MRIFETTHDHAVLPGLYMVARLDGRGFGKLGRAEHGFKDPYDAPFRDHMVAATEALMRCGFQVVYGYTQSDEISLLFHQGENSYARKVRKYNSLLAGTASAAFSLRLGRIACFDCRLIALPTPGMVVEYFLWRVEDAERNAVNARCTYALRRSGMTSQETAAALHGLSEVDKRKLLYRDYDIDFARLPNWKQRGLGIFWETYDKEIVDTVTGETFIAPRRRTVVDLELPGLNEYAEFVRRLAARAGSPS